MLTVAASILFRVLYQVRSRNARGIIINNHALSARQTERMVEILGKSFEFIPVHEVASRVEGPRGPRPFCVMTFDDGRRSNATEAAPQLLRLGVPAAFYLTTSFVDGGKPLWFDRYFALKKALGQLPGSLSLPVLKQLPLKVLEERLERYSEQVKLEFDPGADHLSPMTWDQARWLASQGFTVGAHAVDHSVLTRESWDTAASSIRESMSIVNSRLGRGCESFAFPNGNYTASLCQLARSLGATTVMTTDPMWVTSGADLWRLPRIQLFPHQTGVKITLKVSLALANGALTNPDGTGRAYRRIEVLRRESAKTRALAGRACVVSASRSMQWNENATNHGDELSR
jgi:peptidoglycan/xylan/chitin deacetylase (PgdA/CDA1 family)